MQDIGIGSGRPPEVDRPDGSRSVYLTFRGTNEAKVSRSRHAHQDHDANGRAARLWRELGQVVTDEEKAPVE